VVYEADKDKKDGTVKINKKIAAYQQYNAVNEAISQHLRQRRKTTKQALFGTPKAAAKA
jgi:type I site-specific restriction-modification system R (restriction) subunit